MPRPFAALFLASVLLLGNASAADKAAPLRADYPLQEIAPQVYVIHGPLGAPSPENQGFMNNPAFVLTDAGVVVVDPGGSLQVGEMLLAQIDKITDQPVVAVFNTHVHGDHWLGNQAIRVRYPQATLYGHPHLLEELAKGAGERWVSTMLRVTEGATAGTITVGAEQAVDNGDEIDIGGVRFRILHNGKAHTETDIMVLAVEPGVVFLGDNGLYQRMGSMDHGSFRGNVVALNLALDSGASVYVPGHGPSGGAASASDFRDYLALVYEKASEGYDEGLSDFEIKPQLLPLLERWAGWLNFEISLGKHISLAVLEAEEASFE